MSVHSALAPRPSLRAALAFGLGLALAWPGVEVRAEGDLAPSSRALTRLDAAPAPPPAPAAGGDSCAASDPTRVAQEYEAQRASLEALAAAMRAQEEAGDFVVLDGRGNGYFAERNPALEIARLQREAQLQARAPAEAGAAQ
jgi:hypothetical protein